MPLLAAVVQAREWEITVLSEEARQVPEAAHRDDGDSLGPKVAATASCERIQGAPVARALDENHSAQLHTASDQVEGGRRSGACGPAGTRSRNESFGRSIRG
jgi:hypothetical protein